MLTPLKPHFYVVKLGLQGYTLFFLFLLKNLSKAVLTHTHNICFEKKCEKYLNFLSENFPCFGCKIFNIFEKACFHNVVEKSALSGSWPSCSKHR